MEMYDYKFSPEHLPYMHEQIWESRPNLAVYSEASNPDSTMIFGCRDPFQENGPFYDATSFADRFKEVFYIPGIPTQVYARENWLVLRDPR